MTGKYGVGWMFITQTLHDFDKTILRQLQVKIFGQGSNSAPTASMSRPNWARGVCTLLFPPRSETHRALHVYGDRDRL
jgi:hypothetical protein